MREINQQFKKRYEATLNQLTGDQRLEIANYVGSLESIVFDAQYAEQKKEEESKVSEWTKRTEARQREHDAIRQERSPGMFDPL